MENTILKTDSYKFSHWKQLPPGTTIVRSYMEPRGGPFPKLLTFGALQVSLSELFLHPITREMINEAQDFVDGHMGLGVFNRAGWEHILKEHDGFIPLRVRTVPEGLFVPIKNVALTVENTDAALPWLTSYFESALYSWYPYTVATIAHQCRQIILKYLEATGDPATIDFKLHDFGYRGTTDPFVAWQAMVGGLAHLVSFKGTDNVPALWAARKYYQTKMAGFSIPAAEHSTITSWGQENEVHAYHNMLTQYSTGKVAVVSDSYNIYNACEHLWGEILRDKVLSRDGVLVIRPDSGNPPAVVMKCLRILDAKFGSKLNHKGFRVLDPHVRLLQGDGVDAQCIDMVYAVMQINGYSADNVGFGMGGALLQKWTRDSMEWGFKCMQTVQHGQEFDAFKTPVDDPQKRSRGGNLTLYRTFADKDAYVTAPRQGEADAPGKDMMQIAYENGRVFLRDSLDTIRERMQAHEQALTDVVKA
jgi:nicotinamide phosphoribosyltransferase